MVFTYTDLMSCKMIDKYYVPSFKVHVYEKMITESK